MSKQVNYFVCSISILCFAQIILYAQPVRQHPLVGAWEMISVKGIGADGEPFSRDTSTVRELKIITPTHYMLMAEDVENGNIVFNRTYAGTFHINGNGFSEHPVYSSIPIFDNVTTDFAWRREGDKFIQSGTFVRPDGKKVVLDELIFKRAEVNKKYDDNPAIGVWDEVSKDNENKMGFLIITPTHWMNINYTNDKFNSALGGTYKIKGKNSFFKLDHVSNQSLAKMTITQQLRGDQLTLKVVNGKSTEQRIFKRIPIK